jgi:hypothetical protein
MPASQNLSVYLSQEMADEVAEAKEAGLIDPKEVVKAALLVALHPEQVQDTVSTQGEDHEHVVLLSGLVTQAAAAKDQLSEILTLDSPDGVEWAEVTAKVKLLMAEYRRLRALELEASQTDEPQPDVNTSNFISARAQDEYVNEPVTGRGHSGVPIVYELTFANTVDEFNGRLEVIQANNGWIQSHSENPDGSFSLLVAWPQS